MNMFTVSCVATLAVAALASPLLATESTATASVDFSKTLQVWDGFGVNYVETAQTRNYEDWAQDFGGFSKLSEAERQQLMDALYGPDGLGLALHKIFLDPWGQAAPDAPYEFERTTKWSRYFLREAVKRTSAEGRELRILTTLYGPPAWATQQRKLLARDFDPAQADALAKYMAAWVKFLQDKEGVQVEFLSLSNEAKDATFFTEDGMGPRGNSDYNIAWKEDEMINMMRRMRVLLPKVGFTPTEPTGWDGANYYPFTRTKELCDALGIVAAHSFGRSDQWGPDFVKKAREKKPGIPVWTTSHDWRQGGVDFALHTYTQIYTVGVNGIITWQVSKNLSEWRPAPKNPNAAIMMRPSGKPELGRAYFILKQLSRAGQPGMAVAQTAAEHEKVRLMAFASNGTRHPNSLILVNNGDVAISLRLAVSGISASTWHARRTDESAEQWRALEPLRAQEKGSIVTELPPKSVTTLFQSKD